MPERITRTLIEVMNGEPADLYVTRSIIEIMMPDRQGADYIGSHTDAGDWTA